MLNNAPLMIVPLIIYLIVMFLGGAVAWDAQMFVVPMLSGGEWTVKASDLLVTLGLVMLFFEVLKSARFGQTAVVNHLLSTLVTIGYLLIFLLVQGADTSLFFILMLMSLLDLMAGFSVSIRTASRDVAFGGEQGFGGQ